MATLNQADIRGLWLEHKAKAFNDIVGTLGEAGRISLRVEQRLRARIKTAWGSELQALQFQLRNELRTREILITKHKRSA